MATINSSTDTITISTSEVLTINKTDSSLQISTQK